jgi:hypothetical protein
MTPPCPAARGRHRPLPCADGGGTLAAVRSLAAASRERSLLMSTVAEPQFCRPTGWRPNSNGPPTTRRPWMRCIVDAALGPVRPLCPGRVDRPLRGALARQPVTTARRVGGVARELSRVAVGASTVAPFRRDRRFTDPAWDEKPILRRLMQGYLRGPTRCSNSWPTPTWTGSTSTGSACSSRTLFRSPRRATFRWSTLRPRRP